MEIIVFLSIVIAVLAVLTSIVLVRRVKNQIAEMTDVLVDVKNGNGNRRILSATNELTAPLAYEINEIVVAYESRLSTVRQTEETNRQLMTSLSHDVRTPLTTLLGYLDAAHKGLVTGKDRDDYIETARRKAHDLKEYIDVLFDWFKLNSNEFALEIVVDEPKGSAEELAQVTDVLGSFTTSYKTSGSSRSANVANGCSLINGTTLYPGEEFSTYKTVSPFSVANGYYMAGSYVSGKVVDSLGGGICQVSTTLYNAVLLAELEVTERYNHSMIVGYVDPSADAAIAESSGKDFKFVNNTDAPIYIEGYTHDKQITFNIYGKETRAAGHSVRYESEVLETITPPADQIYADAGQPIGYIVTESAHIGYKARLWKITMENGVEVSREQVNSSTYKMVPRSATVGTATSDPQAYEEIMAAISTANIDHVKNVAAALNARAAAAAGQTEIVDD